MSGNSTNGSTGNNSSEPPLNPNVVVLSNSTEADLLWYSPGAEYVFSPNASQLANVTAGDVLVSNGSVPLLFNVSSTSSNASGYCIFGSNASLGSLFEPGNYTFSVGNSSADPSFGFNGSWLNGALSIAFGGSVSAGASLSIDVCTVLYVITYLCGFDFSTTVTEKGWLNVTIAHALSKTEQITGPSFDLDCIPVEVGCIVPQVSLDAGITVSASASYWANASLTMQQTAWVKCTPGCSAGYTPTVTPSFQQGVGAAASVEVYADTPKISFLFDGAAGPYVGVRPSLTFTANFGGSSASWTLQASVSVSAGVDSAAWLGGFSYGTTWTVWSDTLASGSLTTYSVVVPESGLEAGLTFGVTVQGIPYSLVTDGGTDRLGLSLPTGSFPYSIAAIPYWSQTTLPSEGNFTVAGGPVTEPTLVYAGKPFTAVFCEVGLPEYGNGSPVDSWSVTVAGAKEAGATTCHTFSEAGGPYSYSVAGPSAYTPSPGSGTVAATRSTVNVNVTFVPKGGGGGCVAYGTPILTPTGYVPIQELRPGADVEEYDFAAGGLVVGQLASAATTPVLRLVDVDYGLLFLTLTDQPIFVANATYVGWLHDPDLLTTADWLFDPVSDAWIPVHAVTVVHELDLVYDVVTTGFNNFVGDGVLLDLKACAACTGSPAPSSPVETPATAGAPAAVPAVARAPRNPL